MTEKTGAGSRLGWALRAALLGLYALALTLASLVVVGMDMTGGEPYHRFRPEDAFVQVGLGTTVLVLWAQLALSLLAGIVTGRVPRAALAVVAWAVVVVVWGNLPVKPLGYLREVAANAGKQEPLPALPVTTTR